MDRCLPPPRVLPLRHLSLYPTCPTPPSPFFVPHLSNAPFPMRRARPSAQASPRSRASLLPTPSPHVPPPRSTHSPALTCGAPPPSNTHALLAPPPPPLLARVLRKEPDRARGLPPGRGPMRAAASSRRPGRPRQGGSAGLRRRRWPPPRRPASCPGAAWAASADTARWGRLRGRSGNRQGTPRRRHDATVAHQVGSRAGR